MKYFILEKIVTKLNEFSKIFNIVRVDDNVLKLTCDKDYELYVDLKRGNSSCFTCKNYNQQKIYNAPFDVLLNKCFSNSSIQKIELLKNNRIVKIKVKTNLAYKSNIYILQLEFTGKNTNAIILNEQNIVQEALRHIDKSVSFRNINVGEELASLEEFEIKEKVFEIDNLDEYLNQVYIQNQQKYLQINKLSKISSLQKKLNTASDTLKTLKSQQELLANAQKLSFDASVVLANLHAIKPYEKCVKLLDFEQNLVKINIPNEAKSAQHGANLMYQNAKKLKQKAKFVHKQKQNLQEKIQFYTNLINMIENACSIDEVNILTPKPQNKNKKQEKKLPYEVFFMQGYKILVGKSAKSNISIFKIAKKNDIWLHIQNVPSSHVIIKTDKQNIPLNVITFAAKLCVNFSVTQKGSFLVDYTKWQYVKISESSHVNYTNYKSIKMDK